MRASHVPEWYIDICKKIKYLFPRAHSTGYTLSAIRAAWYKLYYPRDFFQVMYGIHNDALTSEDLLLNLQQLSKLVFESRARNQPIAEDNKLYSFLMKDQGLSEHPYRQMMLELLLEMKARGVDVTNA